MVSFIPGKKIVVAEYLEALALLKNLSFEDNESSRINSIVLFMTQVLDLPVYSTKDLQYLKQVIESNVYYSTFDSNPQLKKKLDSVVQRVNDRFPCVSYVIPLLLEGKISTMDLLNNNIKDFQCIIDVVEYINRRNLFN